MQVSIDPRGDPRREVGGGEHMTDWYDEDDPAVGVGGTSESTDSGVHCDACGEWMDVGDDNCPNCGSGR
tara:strand:- start:206 stop:412 length:207 start_codon:yes stop_codon:yes gene_type:complete